MMAENLLRLFPDLEVVEPLMVLGSGFRSVVIEAAGVMVFRIGKNEVAAAGYARENKLLPLLLSHLPVAVPSPQWYAGPNELFPFGVMGYLKVPGQSLTSQDLLNEPMYHLATPLAHFLLALHRFPITQAADVGTPKWNTHDRASTWRDVVLPVLHDTMTRAEYGQIVRWWHNFLSDPALCQYESALVHGDLWYEHVLVDKSLRRITGIVDFEATRIGDPAQDFATQRHLGAPFTARVLVAYQAAGGHVGVNADHRIQKLWELREFDGLQFAAQAGDVSEIDDAVRKLRAGPVLNAGIQS